MKPTGKVAAAASALAILSSLALSASAAVVTYNDRPTWLSAVGPLTGTENFNGFATDTSVVPGPVGANNMALSGNGSGSVNFVDVSPYLEAGYSGDSTTFVNVNLRLNVDYFRIDFTNQVSAWGVDLTGVSNDGRTTRIDIFDATSVLLDSINLPGVSGTYTPQFFGFELTGGDRAGHLVFVYASGTPAIDAFGVDNIGFVTVPEPGTLTLLGLGLAGLAALRRRRQ